MFKVESDFQSLYCSENYWNRTKGILIIFQLQMQLKLFYLDDLLQLQSYAQAFSWLAKLNLHACRREAEEYFWTPNWFSKWLVIVIKQCWRSFFLANPSLPHLLHSSPLPPSFYLSLPPSSQTTAVLCLLLTFFPFSVSAYLPSVGI